MAIRRGVISVDMEELFTKADQKALVANNAQEIFNALEELENNRNMYQERWIWELIQNALDSKAEKQGIDIEIRLENNILRFRHNGRPFELEEVFHLIRHGSTKKDAQRYKGKFGTGFFSTHLLSKKVNIISAVIIEGSKKNFTITIDRDGSADNIKLHTEKCISDFKILLDGDNKNENEDTEYEYKLVDQNAHTTAKNGIDALRRTAPLIFAFNSDLKSININVDGNVTKFVRSGIQKSNNGLLEDNIEEKTQSSSATIMVYSILKNGTQVALLLGKNDKGKKHILSLDNIPKFFLYFPMFDTVNIPFPAIVSSSSFKPTEKRDSIILTTENTADVIANKSIINFAKELFIELLSKTPKDLLDTSYHLLKLNSMPQKTGFDDKWLKKVLSELIEQVEKLELLKNTDGEFNRLNDSLIPFAHDPNNVREVFNIAWHFNLYKPKLPDNDYVILWDAILKSWEALGFDVEDLKLTTDKLVARISTYTDINSFKKELDADEFAVLNSAYTLMQKEKINFQDSKIIPNQNEIFCRIKELSKDKINDEKLKDILFYLGEDIRSKLVHPSASEEVKGSLSEKGLEETLSVILDKNKKINETDNYLLANAELLKWLIQKGRIEELQGFPIMAADGSLIILDNKKDEKPICPQSLWDKSAAAYYDIFPQGFIMSPKYHEFIKEQEYWTRLGEEGFILLDTLTKISASLDTNEIEQLLDPEETQLYNSSGDINHHIDKVELSDIAFIVKKDKGILDTSRNSSQKSIKFLKYLLEYVIIKDTNWDKFEQVNCSCLKKHKIRKAFWFSRIGGDRQWVNIGRNKGGELGIKSLSLLLKNTEASGLEDMCKTESAIKLLHALDISIADLIKATLTNESNKRSVDNITVSLISAIGEDSEKLSKLDESLKDDPITVITGIITQINNSESAKRNRAVGESVENLMKTVLESQGLKVERTGIGSDYEIENDFIEGGKENGLELGKFLVEIKSSTHNSFKMTPTQADFAIKNEDRFILAIVDLSDQETIDENIIKERAKFIMNIGEKLKNRVGKVKGFEQESTSNNDIIVDFDKNNLRYRLGKPVIDSGKTLTQLLDILAKSDVNV